VAPLTACALRAFVQPPRAKLCGISNLEPPPTTTTYEVNLVRHGGAALAGGLPFELTQLLRLGTQRHPHQGELLLLAGDLLAQVDISSRDLRARPLE
jgi:hypothetical protein